MLTALIKLKGVRWFARKLWPFTDRDLIERYINFFEVSLSASQAEVFNRLQGYYPNSATEQTKCIVLPMDMAFMKAGPVPVDLDKQHEELSKLAQLNPAVIPFIGVDARRNNLLKMVQKWHKQHGFKGIKLYPPMGYYPNDIRLEPVYEYAQANNLPVMSHCSRGGVYSKKVTKAMLQEPHPLGKPVVKQKPKAFTDIYTHPANYELIANKYPNLKICLAHFGGDTEWDKYFEDAWSPDSSEENKSWLAVITDLIQAHDNIYTDISSTLFKKDHYLDLLLVLLENKKIRERVLFGSDFYMMEREKSEERKMAIKIRSRLGETLFKQIAVTNPKRYLGE